MSFQDMAWAIKQECGGPTGKLILLSIANYSDENGYSFPSKKRLSEDCEVSENCVQSWLGKLSDRGLLEVQKRNAKTGRQTSNGYQLRVGPKSAPSPKSGPTEGQISGPPYNEPTIYEPTTLKNNKKDFMITRFYEFWDQFPRQRRGSKTKAQKAYSRAVKDGRGTELEIHAGLIDYLTSTDVAGGYAAGAEKWLNNDGWTNFYKQFDQKEETGILGVVQELIQERGGIQ